MLWAQSGSQGSLEFILRALCLWDQVGECSHTTAAWLGFSLAEEWVFGAVKDVEGWSAWTQIGCCTPWVLQQWLEWRGEKSEGTRLLGLQLVTALPSFEGLLCQPFARAEHFLQVFFLLCFPLLSERLIQYKYSVSLTVFGSDSGKPLISGGYLGSNE